ncbi:MAG TPA: hypothetical protein VMY37_01295 [Thermoguttaceae bacterium]|nr:hypothetical protein [Thermoguttaceae bacterium]HUU85195.1 hypothetical protein [Phycisphaerae bacterium]
MDPYLYQYAIGGLVFVIGLIYAARQGYVGFTGRKALHLAVLIGGLLAFARVQACLQYAPMQTADEVARQGGIERKQVPGTTLDYGIVAACFVAILAIGT